LTNLDPELNRANERFNIACESISWRAEEMAELLVLMIIGLTPFWNTPRHREAFLFHDGFLAAGELIKSGALLGPVPFFSTTGRLALATRHTTEKKGFVKNS